MNFIKNSAKNRVFCDAFIRVIAIETLLSGEIDFNIQIASYSKYQYEIRNGRHGGYNFVKASTYINENEQKRIAQIVKEEFERRLQNIFDLRNFLAEKLNLSDDYLHCLNEPNNLEYTFHLAKKKRLKLGS